MHRFRLIIAAAFLLVAACASTQPEGPGPGPGPDNPGPTLNGVRHDTATANKFIRRYPNLRVGFVNYFESTRVKLNSHQIAGDGVVFRLNLTGDNGEFHKAAVELAVELIDKNGWDQRQLEEENSAPGHLAAVRIESLGMPVDARPGDVLPVRVVLTGDATDINDGYMYPTPLRNSAGRTVALFRGGYLPHIPVVDPNHPENNEVWRDAKGNELPPGALPLLEKREVAGRFVFFLREGVELTASMTSDDLGADTIEIPLVREVDDETGRKVDVKTISAEQVPDVVLALQQELEAAGVPNKVEAENSTKLIITPLGVREKSLKQVVEVIKNLKVDIKPRSAVIIVFDEEFHRVAIYGPVNKRFLIDAVTLVVDPFTENQRDPQSGKPVTPYALPFRVRCTISRRADPGKSDRYGIPDADDVRAGRLPDGDKGQVRLSWSLRDSGGGEISHGDESFDSTDISDVLRHLWTRGMGPREVLGFCMRANQGLALSCELGFNYRKVNLTALDGPLPEVPDGG